MAENRKIRIKTNKGEFVAEMFEDKAPMIAPTFIAPMKTPTWESFNVNSVCFSRRGPTVATTPMS